MDKNRFKQLLESTMGNVKPLVSEQMVPTPKTPTPTPTPKTQTLKQNMVDNFTRKLSEITNLLTNILDRTYDKVIDGSDDVKSFMIKFLNEFGNKIKDPSYQVRDLDIYKRKIQSIGKRFFLKDGRQTGLNRNDMLNIIDAYSYGLKLLDTNAEEFTINNGYHIQNFLNKFLRDLNDVKPEVQKPMSLPTKELTPIKTSFDQEPSL